MVQIQCGIEPLQTSESVSISKSPLIKSSGLGLVYVVGTIGTLYVGTYLYLRLGQGPLATTGIPTIIIKLSLVFSKIKL